MPSNAKLIYGFSGLIVGALACGIVLHGTPPAAQLELEQARARIRVLEGKLRETEAASKVVVDTAEPPVGPVPVEDQAILVESTPETPQPEANAEQRTAGQIVEDSLGELYLALGYTGLTRHDLINMATSSRDSVLRAAALILFLEGALELDEEMAKETCLSIVGGQELDERSLVAARQFAELAEEGDRERLVSAISQARFPGDWSAAVAMLELGDPTHLDRWAVQSLEEITERGDRRTGVRVVEAARLYDFPLREDLAIAAAMSEAPRVRESVIPLLLEIGSEACLRHLDRLAEDPDSAVSAKARLWRKGIRLSAPTDRK